MNKMASAVADYHPISIEDEEQLLQGEGARRVNVGLDCFSILCGVLVAVGLLLLLGVIIYYFLTPSIANKK